MGRIEVVATSLLLNLAISTYCFGQTADTCRTVLSAAKDLMQSEMSDDQKRAVFSQFPTIFRYDGSTDQLIQTCSGANTTAAPPDRAAQANAEISRRAYFNCLAASGDRRDTNAFSRDAKCRMDPMWWAKAPPSARGNAGGSTVICVNLGNGFSSCSD